jgi:hypothetical protein
MSDAAGAAQFHSVIRSATADLQHSDLIRVSVFAILVSALPSRLSSRLRAFAALLPQGVAA